MSDSIATEYADPRSSGHPHDLQVHRYREIGITALAAALHVMAKPTAPESGATLDERRIPIPAILRGDDLAA
jgi:hypothetical protein